MQVSQHTAGRAARSAYSGPMFLAISLDDKTRAVQRALVARGHSLPKFGADGDWGHETADAALVEFAVAMPEQAAPKIGLRPDDFAEAADLLNCSIAQIRAVDEVESGGGWFEDVRADILDLDGPGGFIGGPELPKILFEAHQFSKRTGRRFDDSHPNLSSTRWNRALYVGGEAEWVRLHRAMELDRWAALMSASVGRYQIMGFNHALAGFDDVEAFWDAMKTSELWHLKAFVEFIRNTHLTEMLRRVSSVPEDCAPFALGYNGSGYRTNRYHEKIAKAFVKHSKKA